MALVFFETPRLTWRRFEPGDLDALAGICADAETSRYIGDGLPLTREKTRQWIENSRSNIERYGYGTGAVAMRNGSTLVGWGGFARPAGGLEEVIYGFDRAYWGRGLGTEFLAGLVNWARSTLEIDELRATVSPENTASITMLTGRGFALACACYEGDPDTHLYVAPGCCPEL